MAHPQGGKKINWGCLIGLVVAAVLDVLGWWAIWLAVKAVFIAVVGGG
jgi:hypothetical protein